MDADTYTLIRFRAQEPRVVGPLLAEKGLESNAAVLIEARDE